MDDAGRLAVEAYLRAYGPATTDKLRYWLGNGLGVGGRRIMYWISDLGDRVAEIDVDGESNLALRDDLEALHAARDSAAVRFLPGLDQWVIGPGTADAHIVPPSHDRR